MSRGAGSLLVVGTGIQLGGQITVEALDAIRRADCVPYFVADAHAARWIESLNPTAENLARLYAPGKPRLETYREAVEHIVGQVRAGHRVCAAFYGHPGVFAYPSHESVRQARAEGFEARMLPGVSAEDCLFADLGLDPAQRGCQSYEVTDFLLRPRIFDPRLLLLFWQVGVIGETSIGDGAPRASRVQVLIDALLGHYPPDHEVIVYEAAVYAVCKPRILRVPLDGLASATIGPMATLVVPPHGELREDPSMAERLFR
jgi:uncharacterized protein YabN with tetrapyrrole methylase and pyrophosphatase domain